MKEWIRHILDAEGRNASIARTFFVITLAYLLAGGAALLLIYCQW